MIYSPDFYNHQIREISHCFNGRKVLVWGITKRGQLIRDALEYCGFSCEAFISSRRNRNSYFGLQICSPDVLEVEKHYVINAAFSSAEEIDKALLEKGFVQEGWRDCFRSTDWHDDLLHKGCPIGRGTYGFDTFMQADRLLVRRIGRYCSINESARCHGNHPTQFVTTSTFPFDKGHYPPPPSSSDAACVFNGKCFESSVEEERRTQYQSIEIGNDIWIGANAIILPHVKIGDGAIVGAGAVVTHDVPPYAIVGGIPAKIIRYRFSPEIIESLLRIQWWDWPVSRIYENQELFTQPELFCKAFDGHFEA